MGEIKFRAWIEESKTMEVGLFGLRSDGKASFNKEAILLQFTGLKDKNGKDIYEGDILKDVNFGYNTKVVYVGSQFVSESNVGYVGLFETENYEVIGNIYENKELINP